MKIIKKIPVKQLVLINLLLMFLYIQKIFSQPPPIGNVNNRFSGNALADDTEISSLIFIGVVCTITAILVFIFVKVKHLKNRKA